MSSGLSSGAGLTGETVDLLKILKNPKGFKKRLDQLETAETNAREMVALVAPAEDILRLKKAAVVFEQEAELLLINAREEAKQIIQRAEVTADTIMGDASAAALVVRNADQEMADRTEKLNTQAIAKLTELERKDQELTNKLSDLNHARSAVVQTEQDLESQKQLLLKEKSQLASVREQIDNFLR